MINFRCPKCNDMISVPETLAGEKETCPSCDNVCIVPQMAVPPPPASVPASPVPVQRVEQVITIQPTMGKSFSGLGLASIVLGIIACVSCWVPFVGCFSLPFSILSVLFGAIGLLLALVWRKSAVGMPLAGLIIGATALCLFFAVTGGTVALMGSAADRAKGETAKAQVRQAAMEIEQYRTKNGSYPPSLVVMYQGVQRVPTDPWGSELQYKRDGDKYRLWSCGPDKKSGTVDDIAAE